MKAAEEVAELYLFFLLSSVRGQRHSVGGKRRCGVNFASCGDVRRDRRSARDGFGTENCFAAVEPLGLIQM